MPQIFPMVGKRKTLNFIAGVILTALAAIGIILPLLPTTPFLLLAAWCFANSSERCHRWLIEHRIFGPILKNWHENRCIPKRAKILAVSMILIFGTYAIGFAIENTAVRITGTLFLLAGFISVIRIPSCD
jgi:uncharacterized membrane protein YbaN (DUF454 family)